MEEKEEEEEAQSLQKKKRRVLVQELLQNISQEDLLEAIGLDPSQIQNFIESGELEHIIEKV